MSDLTEMNFELRYSYEIKLIFLVFDAATASGKNGSWGPSNVHSPSNPDASIFEDKSAASLGSLVIIGASIFMRSF